MGDAKGPYQVLEIKTGIILMSVQDQVLVKGCVLASGCGQAQYSTRTDSVQRFRLKNLTLRATLKFSLNC